MSNARKKRKLMAVCKRLGKPYTPIRKWGLKRVSLLDQMAHFISQKVKPVKDPLMRGRSGKRWQNEYNK